MSSANRASEDPDIKSSEAALLRAAWRALELGKRTHTPVWVLRDGKLVDLTGEDGSVGPVSSDPPGGVPSDR